MKLRVAIVCVVCLVCLAVAPSAPADTLTLKNGQVLEGYFAGGNANGVTFVGQDGSSKTYALSEVASTITNGTLAVDFYDPTSQPLIWRGSGAQTLNPGGNQEKDRQRLNKVAKLLKNFPPNQKKTSGW